MRRPPTRRNGSRRLDSPVAGIATSCALPEFCALVDSGAVAAAEASGGVAAADASGGVVALVDACVSGAAKGTTVISKEKSFSEPSTLMVPPIVAFPGTIPVIIPVSSTVRMSGFPEAYTIVAGTLPGVMTATWPVFPTVRLVREGTASTRGSSSPNTSSAGELAWTASVPAGTAGMSAASRTTRCTADSMDSAEP